MRRPARSRCRVVLWLAAAFCLPAGAAAEEKVAAQPAAWVKVCEGESPVRVCVTHHERIDGRAGRIIAAAAIREVEGVSRRVLAIILPPGLREDPGVQVKIDGNEPFALRRLKCTREHCASVARVTPEFLEQARSGRMMIVAAIDPAGRTVGFPMHLAGFGAAMDGPSTDFAKYEEMRGRIVDVIVSRMANIDEAERARRAAELKQRSSAALFLRETASE
jgi:invasion protein IalB